MGLRYLVVIVMIIFFNIYCQSDRQTEIIGTYKMEVLQTERAFAKMVKDEGLKIAFTTYAADSAVLKRGNELIKGKKAIEDYYKNFKYPDARLHWEPDFIDVSESGNMAYTYGTYTFEATDDSGIVIQDTGIFHTVWKRQPDGQWRYVWD